MVFTACPYKQELADTGAPDHDGTILEASDAVRRGLNLLPWRHVIVDGIRT